MKIKVKKTTEEEFEIKPPHYTGSSCLFAKIYSEKECIKVCILEGHEQISIEGATNALADIFKPSNETEFLEAFEKVSEILKSKAIKKL